MDSKFGLRRIYRKSWPYDNLFGSSRFELTSSHRGIWNDLLDLAKLSRVKPGLIAPAEGSSYPHAWLAEVLNVSKVELEEALKVLIATKRITENSHGIEIINWSKYQTEYDRQKPYRQKDIKPELTPEQKQDSERRNKIAVAVMEEKGKLGRNLSPSERKAVADKI